MAEIPAIPHRVLRLRNALWDLGIDTANLSPDELIALREKTLRTIGRAQKGTTIRLKLARCDDPELRRRLVLGDVSDASIEFGLEEVKRTNLEDET